VVLNIILNIIQVIILNQNGKKTLILIWVIFDPLMEECRVQSLVHLRVKLIKLAGQGAWLSKADIRRVQDCPHSSVAVASIWNQVGFQVLFWGAAVVQV